MRCWWKAQKAHGTQIRLVLAEVLFFSPQVLSRQATNKLSRQAVQVEPTCHHDQHIRTGLTGPDPQARLIGIKVRKIQT